LKTENPYLAIHNLGLLQRQTGVDPEIADLVIAYARILADARRQFVFEKKSFEAGSPEQKIQKRIAAKNRDLDSKFISFLALYGGEMMRRGYPVIFNKADFCRKVGISEKKLNWLSFNQTKFYKLCSIPKKNGKKRDILNPNSLMRKLQHWIQYGILARTKPHDSAHGFVKGRSILTNAKPHIGKKVVVRLDIEEFFPSIDHQSVRKVFQQIGYPYRVAVLLADVCTVDGQLPQGAITSPALSNLVCVKLDKRLSGLSKRRYFTYTRYADDLIFSSNNPKLTSLIPFFREIILEEGFKLQEQKTKVMRQGGRQIVTGIVSNKKANLPREHRRIIRATMYKLEKEGLAGVSLPYHRDDKKKPVNVLRGHIAFWEMVNPKGAKPYKKAIKTLIF
jgi:retron-type reverse transcriptase